MQNLCITILLLILIYFIVNSFTLKYENFENKKNDSNLNNKLVEIENKLSTKITKLQTQVNRLPQQIDKETSNDNNVQKLSIQVKKTRQELISINKTVEEIRNQVNKMLKKAAQSTQDAKQVSDNELNCTTK